MGLIIVIFVFLCVCWIIGELMKDEKVKILYGYPTYEKTWLNVYHYRKSDRWVFEWDDLFDSGRPKDWGHISECLMYKNKRADVTQEEFDEAYRRLEERGLA